MTNFLKFLLYLFEDVDYKRMSYHKYLTTYHWELVKQTKLDEVDHRCQVCYSPKKLNVHHRTYERLGNEKLTDLTVLCQECHQLFHDNGKLKKT